MSDFPENELPVNWACTRIGDCCDIVAGVGFPRSEQGVRDAEVPFYKVGDISRAWQVGDTFLENSPNTVTHQTAERLASRLVAPGTVVFAKIGAAIALNRRAITSRPSLVDNNVMGLRPWAEMPSKFVFYFTCRLSLDDYSRATTVPSIRKSDVAGIEFPLPPIPEQHRIVEAIESYLTRLDDAVTTLERVQRNLKRYRASVLKAAVEGRLVPTEAELARAEGREYEPACILVNGVAVPPRPHRFKTRSTDVIEGHGALAVGNPGSKLPEGWTWSHLLDIARLESGHTPSRRHPEWWGGDVAWIGIPDARDHHGGTINETRQNTNADGLANSAARLLPANTVCVSRTASVGYVVVTGKPMATSQDFVNWICTDALDPDWLRVVFMADKEALLRFGKGTVHKTIYYPEVLSLHVAVPPLAEQRRIVAEVDRLLSLADSSEAVVKRQQTKCTRLRQSVLKWAFEGKLADQDPNDEPAADLLKRIQAERAKVAATPRRRRRGRA